MSDGPIPLFGSLPSAVSRQWGYVSNRKDGDIMYLVSAKNSIVLATATSYSGRAAAISTSDCDEIKFSFVLDNPGNFRWFAICW